MSEEEKQYFFNFSFFKIDPKWRWMADLAKEESARELENIIENSPVNIRSYSTLGLRDDADFLLWFMSESIEDIQETISKIYSDCGWKIHYSITGVFIIYTSLNLCSKK